MASYAEINKDGIVQQVIIAEQEFIDSGAMGDSSNWVQGSGGIGSTYDKTNDVFIRRQPFPSWTLDASFEWQPPANANNTLPAGANVKGGKGYIWDEDEYAWVEAVSHKP